ncbi:hypothetical protein ABEF93_002568 [Exophiala dermatitidis]
MKNYEYPQVRPPTSASLQPPPQIPGAGTGPRFSWMDTPAVEENQVFTNSAARTTSTNTSRINLPPLQVSGAQEEQQQQYMATHGYNSGPYAGLTHDAATQVVQQQQQQQSQQQFGPGSPQHGAYSTLAHGMPTRGSSPSGQPQPQPQQEHIPPAAAQPQLQDLDQIPTKQTQTRHHEPTKPIVPDTNPLTPTTPKFHEPASTNMAIVAPATDPSQFSVSTFIPSPQAIRGGVWQHGLCSCAEPSTCLMALFCPCVVYGKTQYRLNLRADKKCPTNMLGYAAVNGSCIAFGVLCGINGILASIQHTRVRKTYGMSSAAGNVAGDCLKGFCCCCCVVAQDEKEVKFREEQARKPGGSGTRKEGYVAPTGMTFSAPPR